MCALHGGDSTIGGDEGNRTPDPLLAKQVLSQLSYTPASVLSRSALRSESPVCSSVTENRTTKVSESLVFHLRFFIEFGSMCCVQQLLHVLHRKEVIQPHLPIRLPCYDLTPIIEPTFGSALLAVRLLTSGIPNFHGLTGGVYKARERIHRGMLIRDY